MSNPLFKLDITEDYDNIPLLRKKDEYLIYESFCRRRFQKCGIKGIEFCQEVSPSSHFG